MPSIIRLPSIPEGCQTNYHLFYVLLPTADERNRVLDEVRAAGVHSVFHYVPLHSSPKGRELCGDVSLPVTEELSARLLRLPLFYELTEEIQQKVIQEVVASIEASPAQGSIRKAA